MYVKLKINGNWPSISHQLRSQFPSLQESDLRFKRGDESTLVERLSGKLRLPQEEIYSVLLKLQLKGELAEQA